MPCKCCTVPAEHLYLLVSQSSTRVLRSHADECDLCDIMMRSANVSAMWRDSIRWCYRKIIKIHVTICLGPESDAPGHGLGQCVLQVALPVEIAFHRGARDADFELVPLTARGRSVSNPLHRGALALFELPQHEIIFETVRPDGQIVAVRLQVEQDAGPLIDAAGNGFEGHSGVAIPEILDVLRDGIREIRIGLHPVEKLGVALAVQHARLVGDPGGGLPFLPLTAVDRQHLVPAFIFNPPNADDAHEGLWFGTHGIVGKLDLHGLLCRDNGQDQCCKPTNGDAYSSEAL